MMPKALFATALVFVAAHAASAQKIAKLTEDLRLDATKEDFPAVRQVAVGPKGQIVVGIPRENTLRVYDSNGKKLGVVGRLGSGPGEFRGIGTIGWVGDTMWVDDYQLRRISYFAPDLKLLRTSPTPAPHFADEKIPEGNLRGVNFSTYVVYPDGSMLGDANRATSSERGKPWERFIAFQSPTGQLTRAKGSPKFEDDRWSLFYAGFENGVPFVTWPQIGWATDGSRYGFMTVENAKDGGTIRLAIYRRDGAVELEKSIPFKGVPIPSSVRDSALNAFIPPGGRPMEGPPEMPKRFQDMARERMPSFYNPVESMILGLDKTVWVLRPTRNDQWSADVYDGTGKLLGRVEPPFKTRIRFGTATHVWTTQRDADDVISVVRYRITWQ